MYILFALLSCFRTSYLRDSFTKCGEIANITRLGTDEESRWRCCQWDVFEEGRENLLHIQISSTSIQQKGYPDTSDLREEVRIIYEFLTFEKYSNSLNGIRKFFRELFYQRSKRYINSNKLKARVIFKCQKTR